MSPLPQWTSTTQAKLGRMCQTLAYWRQWKQQSENRSAKKISISALCASVSAKPPKHVCVCTSGCTVCQMLPISPHACPNYWHKRPKEVQLYQIHNVCIVLMNILFADLGSNNHFCHRMHSLWTNCKGGAKGQTNSMTTSNLGQVGYEESLTVHNGYWNLYM